ncbi:hypothetical protein JKF63_04096 [Porcisia hertigi]|uniref:Uncharacterized protein n=1 Tax=Porcisia hertigi TaxID=2761500 RepID=A0A836HZG7_9TRYP|nr:hypothetical protein JKF63_04096 [Porcisia hertigi]
MPNVGSTKSRYDDSMQGWSIVEKVAQFSQAVGRVSGGRGSAILIALIDSKGNLIDTPLGKRSGDTGIGGTNPSHSYTYSHHGNGGLFSARRPGHINSGGWGAGRSISGSARDSPENVGQPGASHSPTSSRIPPALGVLLTTSHVFSTPGDTVNASVCFLDQPTVGMATWLCREPKPVHVELCSTFGFVSSVSAATEDARRASDAAAARRARLANEPEYLLYDAAASYSEKVEEEIGFTLTYCEVFPTCDQEAILPLPPNQIRPGGSCEDYPKSPVPRPPGCVLGYGGGGLGGEADGAPVFPSDSGLPQQHGESSSSSHAFRVPGGHRSNHLTTDTSSRSIGNSQNSLFEVQPLPVPLLLSRIPAIHVSDVHLMITHVNGGRRSYRIAHVGAVFADYCVYRPIDVGGVASSGGPVFNIQGDFIGVQHERNSHCICLFTKSIVQHLFRADLLGMCRSPVSEETLKQREKNARPGDVLLSSMATSRLPAVSGLKGISPSKKSGRHAPPSFTDAAAGREVAHRGRHNMLSSRLPALSTASKRLGSPCPESCVIADTSSTTMAFHSPTPFRKSSPRAVNHQSSSGVADSSCKSVRPVGKGPPVDRTTESAAPLPCVPLKPFFQYVPSFEEVFAEFFDGPDSLPHILYAFPHSLQLMRITIGMLAQLNSEDGLEYVASIGGVGAILGVIDGYPQEEQIVTGSLAILCRICLDDRSLAMFSHLDGVATVMEIMKEYVHQERVLQWGVHALLLATDMSCTSAAACAEVMVRSSAPQLLVNILRMHGSVQRQLAPVRSPYNRLVRWTCDLIANLLMVNPRCTTLFLREDFLSILLEISRDHASNAFLGEGFAHVFGTFVQCFTEAEVPPTLHTLQVTCASGISKHPAGLSLNNSPVSLSHQRVEQESVSRASSKAFFSDNDDARLRGSNRSFASSLDLSKTIASDPQKISFFFLCDAMRHDTDGYLVRAVIDVCEATLDSKSNLTAHRGRAEVVLMRCLETLRLLLIWRLVQFARGAETSVVENPNLPHLTSSLGTSSTCGSVSSSSPPPTCSPLCEDRLRLLIVCKRVQSEWMFPSELLAQAEVVQRLISQDC